MLGAPLFACLHAQASFGSLALLHKYSSNGIIPNPLRAAGQSLIDPKLSGFQLLLLCGTILLKLLLTPSVTLPPSWSLLGRRFLLPTSIPVRSSPFGNSVLTTQILLNKMGAFGSKGRGSMDSACSTPWARALAALALGKSVCWSLCGPCPTSFHAIKPHTSFPWKLPLDSPTGMVWKL